MRSIFISAMVAWAIAIPARSAVVTFEDLPTPSVGYYNGSDFAGGFADQGVFFNNTFTDFGGGFTAWSGWSYSTLGDTTKSGFENQYSSYAGGGAGGSRTFGVATAFSPGEAYIDLPSGSDPLSIEITNTTYAALAIRDGYFVARPFGPGDYFRVIFTGIDELEQAIGSIDYYLADYRGSGPGFILNEWVTLDLSSLEGARRLDISFESTDVGFFGINTPTYVAVDNLSMTSVPEAGSIVLASVGLGITVILSRRLRSTSVVNPVR